jgi:hypothetical protein
MMMNRVVPLFTRLNMMSSFAFNKIKVKNPVVELDGD